MILIRCLSRLLISRVNKQQPSRLHFLYLRKKSLACLKISLRVFSIQMMTPQVYFYSPLSPESMREPNHRTLLLLFILKELARSPKGVMDGQEPMLPPFDWTIPGPSASKLREHFSLLPIAFPELASQVPTLYQNLYRPAPEVVSLLEPFILACQTSENLLLFLFQHQNVLAVKPLLDKICPEGLKVLKEKIVSGFRKRGYPFTRWTHSSKIL